MIVQAVNDVSFTIDEGEIVGILGRNGAGKSTTIKMLTGVLTPTARARSRLLDTIPSGSAPNTSRISVRCSGKNRS